MEQRFTFGFRLLYLNRVERDHMDARQRFLEVELQSKEQESQRINAMNERDLSNMKLAADRED